MPLLKLTIDEQEQLLNAHLQLDAYEAICKGKDGDKVVRVSYKLGGERRTVAKNVNALRKSLEVWDETRKGLIKEIVPDAGDRDEITKQSHPDQYGPLMDAILAARKKTDEVSLLTFLDKTMYETNELPVAATATLDAHGLIDEAAKG